MKRAFALILCLSLILCLVGCGSTEDPPAPDVFVDGFNYGNQLSQETAEQIHRALHYIDPSDPEEMEAIYMEDLNFRLNYMMADHNEWFPWYEVALYEAYFPGITLGITWIEGRMKSDQYTSYIHEYINEPIWYKTPNGRFVVVFSVYSRWGGDDGLVRNIRWSYENFD